MTVAYENVTRLAFDSGFWGLRMVQVNNEYGIAELDDDIEFAQALVVADRTADINMLTAQGFQVADVRVTLDQPLKRRPPVSIGMVRFYEESDLPALVKIARESHRITRYYADPEFVPDRCDDLYETWVRNSCSGWADAVLVAGWLGYVTIHLDGDTASIGLIAVREDARGQGIGQRLVHAALRWAHEAGAARMEVVTQGRNIQAQRLFQRCGFRTAKTEMWLHKWYR